MPINQEDFNFYYKEESFKDLIKPSHRVLLFIEEANLQWELLESIEFAKKLDIKLTRSIFLFTGFNNLLQNIKNSGNF